MRTSLLAALGCCWLLLAGLAGAQTPVPPVDPALPDQLKELKALVADPKMVADFQAISLMQKLGKDFDARNPKDQERLARGIGDVFRTGKLRTADKQILYREAADALAGMHAEGGKELAKAIGDVRFKDTLPLLCHLTLALGKTEDDKQVDWLVDTTSRSPHDELRAASAEALGNYTSLEIKARREVVKAIVRAWGSLHSKATQADPTNPNAPVDLEPQNARRTLRAVEGKWGATLARLTGVTMTGFTEWQRWLNKNPSWTAPAGKKP